MKKEIWLKPHMLNRDKWQCLHRVRDWMFHTEQNCRCCFCIEKVAFTKQGAATLLNSTKGAIIVFIKQAVLDLRTSNEFLPCPRAPSRKGTMVLEANQTDWTTVHEGLLCSGTVSVRREAYPLEMSRNQNERLNLPHVRTVPRTRVRRLLSSLWLILNLFSGFYLSKWAPLS